MPIFYYTQKENGVYYPRYRLIIAHDNIASDFPIVAKSVARSELSMRPYSRGLIRVGDPKWEYVMPSQVICQNMSRLHWCYAVKRWNSSSGFGGL